jgi:hypothetical protein
LRDRPTDGVTTTSPHHVPGVVREQRTALPF